MRKIAYSLAALALSATSFSTAVLAQQTPTPAFTTVNSDKSGEVSYGELQIVLPNVSQDQFNSADADKSGGLSETEFATITAAGTGSLTTNPPAATGNMSGKNAGSNTGGSNTTSK